MSLLPPPPRLYVVHMNNLIFVDDCKKQELDEFGHTNARNYQLKKEILILVKSWVVQE
jgi:hypothetical protein